MYKIKLADIKKTQACNTFKAQNSTRICLYNIT